MPLWRKTPPKDASRDRSPHADDEPAAEGDDWELDHLPPDEPCALLHGDLLGQNILLPLLELCLAMCWYRDSLDPARRVHPAEQELNRLRGIFKSNRALKRLLRDK